MKIFAVITLCIVTMVVLVSGWLIISRGFSARQKPTAVEAFVARRVRGLATPKAAKNEQNPVAAPSEEACIQSLPICENLRRRI